MIKTLQEASIDGLLPSGHYLLRSILIVFLYIDPNVRDLRKIIQNIKK